MTLALVLGGVRSGKSAHAQRLASGSGRPVNYIATADETDPGMAERIAAHVAARPASWATTPADDELVAAVHARPGDCALIDGLGTWLAGVMHRRDAFDHPDRLLGVRAHVSAQLDALAALAPASARLVIIVAEQAGEGMLPLDRASRVWLDLLGDSIQRLAAVADSVELVVAGRALALPPAADRAASSATRDPSVGRFSPPEDENRPIGEVTGLRPQGDAEPQPGLRFHGDAELEPGLRDHAVNVLAGGVPAWLEPALRHALAHDVDRYPDESAATAAIAALHGRDADEIVITNGAAEALWLLPAALTPQLAVCVHPGFTESEAALRAHGIPVQRVLRDPDAGFALRPEQVPAGAELVIVGNPASPSGTLDPAAAIGALTRRGRTVVVDEAFMGMVPGEPGSLATRRDDGRGGRDRVAADGVVVVRSMTKLLSLPGLRAGYVIAPPALARRIRAVRPPWSANAVALAALRAAAEHPDELAALARRCADEGADLAAQLAGLDGVRTWPTVTNFCLIEVADGPRLHRELRDRGFAVRHAASFPGLDAGHLRLTARDPRDNAALVAALAESIGAARR
jgi:histidinol-phosphate/aromatic aminotransferase/cobyric acid decarboxylase-like protein/adenosyl cobinamide kinase/adenosyl cobinamide phosphate guanylyltransferase